jgi:hypothetical protein
LESALKDFFGIHVLVLTDYFQKILSKKRVLNSEISNYLVVL